SGNIARIEFEGLQKFPLGARMVPIFQQIRAGKGIVGFCESGVQLNSVLGCFLACGKAALGRRKPIKGEMGEIVGKRGRSLSVVRIEFEGLLETGQRGLHASAAAVEKNASLE